MQKDLQLLNDYLAEVLDVSIENIRQDQESETYFGFNFKLNNHHIKFRKAKITPRKIGQFVSLWRRNSQGKTEAFADDEDYNFYIIMTKSDDNIGFFLFPKIILAEHHILSSLGKDGKRGFRVYPELDFPNNQQAVKTKSWQQTFFINMKSLNPNEKQKLKDIFVKYNQ